MKDFSIVKFNPEKGVIVKEKNKNLQRLMSNIFKTVSSDVLQLALVKKGLSTLTI
jgi:hypothetical protein